MSTELVAAVYREVEARRERIISLLQEMVRVPSVVTSGREGECQAIVTRELQRMGAETDVWEPDLAKLQQHRAYVPVARDYRNRPNVVGTWRGTGDGPSLAFNGHVDVVPVDPNTTWSHDPWGGEVADGKLYGRGSADMKGGLAAGIVAMQTLAEMGLRLRGDVIFQSVSDEEDGGNTTLACVLRGHRADATVFLEPTSTRYLVISSRGAQFFRIRVAGEEGGIEYRVESVNAIEKAMLIYQAVAQYANYREATARHPLYNGGRHRTRVPVGVCKINAGVWPSSIPGECTLEGTLECLPGEDIDQVKEDFHRFIQVVASQDPWLREHPPKLEYFGLFLEPAEISPDGPIVAGVREMAAAVTGTEPLVVGGGGSDLRLPVLYADSPSVLFGPRGGRIHSVDEYVELDEVVNVAKIAAALAVRWCGVAP